MANTLQSYALALLKSMGAQSLGTATLAHSGTGTSTFKVPANNLLQSLIEHSPSPETMAQEFMAELGKCEITAVKNLVDALDGDHSVSPDDWATAVAQEIRENEGDMTSLTNLASYYLSHLIVAFRNPCGIRTPQESLPPTPNLTRIDSEEINSLLELSAVHRSQAALKELAFYRDGPRCLITGAPFVGDGSVMPRCAHIIPFSVHEKRIVYHAIERFTGHALRAEDVKHLIDSPSNVINVQTDAKQSMNLKLAWGIEARLVSNEWKYYFRAVRHIPWVIPLDDGVEIEFGKGSGRATIDLPDPRVCNLHLAVARVFAASGAAEVFDKYLGNDEDDLTDAPVFFGGPFIPDDVLTLALVHRLEMLTNTSDCSNS